EQTNFRHSVLEDFQDGVPDLATIDVSFISLDLILPPLSSILKAHGEVVALIKPQFEAEKEEVGVGGIIHDPLVYRKVLEYIIDVVKDLSFALLDLTISTITRTNRNIEFIDYYIKVGP